MFLFKKYAKTAKTTDVVSAAPLLSISLVREVNITIIWVIDTLTHIVERVTILWNLVGFKMEM